MISHVCGALVGLVFLFTGILKALDSVAFARQVGDYRLLPTPRAIRLTAVALTGFECALGTALILAVSPLLLPLTALVLAGFAGLTLWGTSSGRVTDCGCYGGMVMLTPAQSIALDGLYLALLVAAWFTRDPLAAGPAIWQIAVVLAVLIASTTAAFRSRAKPLADFTLLSEGRSWRKGWLKHYERDVTRGSHFVVFLTRTCPHCKRWVPLLNVIEVDQNLPSVVGVMSLEGEQLKGFLSEHLIRFPITHMPQSLVSLMVSAYPTAALVENGKVVKKWIGEIPNEYLDKVRNFYDAVTPPKKKVGGFAG